MHGVNNNHNYRKSDAILQSIKSRPKSEWDAIVYGLSDYANGLWTAEYTIHMKMAAEMNAKANKKEYV